ncbi:M23 family metallopeptidase [Chamaesiphon sp. GL140_3_metabinner_50]|uniref:M23 family metallopeptidase n=1 Tax=Chamaesiphon sp. GL140_3_metabinner_50 TaxID=2970812 RepID=UPI0025E2C865|nr:M23 family metallopeptidase [Chamaesiphon sp. GL140_3_metabinner_50]
MHVKTSLKLLAIAGALLSAGAASAQNSFPSEQFLAAKNTLKTQLLAAKNVADADVTATDINRANQVATDNSNQPISRTEARVAALNSQFGNDEDGIVLPAIPTARLVSARPTQSAVFSSDVANSQQNYQLSGVPTQVGASEASVEIFVPPPKTQTIVVPSVSRLPRVIKTTPLPTKTITPTANVTSFTQNVPARPNNVPTVPSIASVQYNGDPTAPSVELIYPLMNPARVTSGFGWRTHPLTGSRRFHSGIDIGAPTGTPVVATATGTVVSAGWNGGYGKAIVIQHNGVQQTLYGHLSEISVQPGQQITQGSVIGLVGSTGNSTGPHLHFETRSPNATGWVAVDPTPEIQYAVDNLRRSMPYAGKDTPQGL